MTAPTASAGGPVDGVLALPAVVTSSERMLLLVLALAADEDGVVAATVAQVAARTGWQRVQVLSIATRLTHPALARPALLALEPVDGQPRIRLTLEATALADTDSPDSAGHPPPRKEGS